MGYQTEIQTDKPYAFYSMDGFANKVAPLVRGGGYAAHINSANTATLSFPGFVSTRFPKPLAIEFWFKNIAGETEKLILGHAEGNGFFYDPATRKIAFRLKLTTGDVEASTLLVEDKTRHIVGTISQSEMSLYIDGELVDTHSFTFEEQSARFSGIANETQLVSQASADSEHIIDAIAFYTAQIKPDMPKRHFEAGQNVSDIMSAVSQFGGYTIELNRNGLNFVSGKTFSGDTFADGVSENVNYTSGPLKVSDDMSGVWSGTLLNDEIPDKVFVEWEGIGSPAVTFWKDGQEVATLANGSSVVPGEDWEIRLALDSGTEINKVFMGAVKDQYIYASGGSRRAKVSGWLSDKLFYPLHNRDIVGAESPITVEKDPGEVSETLSDPEEGADVVIPARPSELTGSVEFWIKFDSLASGTLFSNATNSVTWSGSAWAKDAGTTVYINGVAGFAGMKVGQWNHVVLTMSPTADAFSIGTTIKSKVGMINLYERQLTPAEVETIYNTYFGKAGLIVTDNGSIAVTESPTAWELYAHEWSIISAGG